MKEFTIDGRRVFDLTQPEGRAQVERIVALVNTLDAPIPKRVAFERRESVLSRIQGARVITDDNMVPEWQRIFEYVWIPREER